MNLTFETQWVWNPPAIAKLLLVVTPNQICDPRKLTTGVNINDRFKFLILQSPNQPQKTRHADAKKTIPSCFQHKLRYIFLLSAYATISSGIAENSQHRWNLTEIYCYSRHKLPPTFVFLLNGFAQLVWLSFSAFECEKIYCCSSYRCFFRITSPFLWLKWYVFSHNDSA